jgi:hypothetical protein
MKKNEKKRKKRKKDDGNAWRIKQWRRHTETKQRGLLSLSKMNHIIKILKDDKK